jgi:hypothetical protein
MNQTGTLHKLHIFLVFFSLALTASAQRRPTPAEPSPASKPPAARLLVQGTYEEDYQGATNEGNASGKLVIKFEATRWLKMTTNEVGNAEFSDLENAPAPSVGGSASYDGRVKSSGSGGDSYEATSSFTGPLAGQDIVVSVPEYTDNGNFKIRVLINPNLKGKCSLVAVRNGETATANGCENGTYFFSASSPIQTDDNEDAAKTADTANLAAFGIELDVEPEAAAATASGSGQGQAGDAGVYAWRGAVTSGSKEAGFKIVLNKTKELPANDKRGASVRKLNFTATIVPK